MKDAPEGAYKAGQANAHESPPVNTLFPPVDELGFETRSNTRNPLLDIASPLLALVIRVRDTEQYEHVEPLYAYVKSQIHGQENQRSDTCQWAFSYIKRAISMKKKQLVWGSIDEEVGQYKTINSKGELAPDVFSQEIVARLLKALRLFFYENGLLTKSFEGDCSESIEGEFYSDDFTAEGVELLKTKVPAWLDSKGAEKNPPNTLILEKALRTIRSKNNSST